MDELQTNPVNPLNQPSQVQTGKSKDPLKMGVMVLAVLLLATVGFSIWQTLQLDTATSKISSLEAAYAELQTGKAAVQAELDTLKGVDSGDAETNPDTVKILAAVDAYVRAPVDATGAFEYTVSKNDDGFAKVNVKVPEGGGYLLWVKKVDDNWTVLFGGQDAPAQSEVDKYGIPAGF